MRVRVLAMVGAVAVGGLTGCGGSSGTHNASVCVQAMDAADQGFDGLAVSIRQMQGALDQAFNGDISGATTAVRAIHGPDAARWKTLEAQCREAAG